jgi:hypothetical protein
MSDRVKLSRVEGALSELEYPITRMEAAQQLDDVTLSFAGGEDNLGGLVSETNSDSFGSPSELEEELYGALPTEAVGKAGRSEGEG